MASQSILDTLGKDEIIADLGKGAAFEGKLTFEGAVRIDGRFTGEIFSDGILIIGEGAQVNAEIAVATVVLQGQLKGNIKAPNCIEIHRTAHMIGNIYTPSLYVEKGAVFEGSSVMDTGRSQKPDRPPVIPAL